MKIEIELPDFEGFELSPGKQPRYAVNGEYYYTHNGDNLKEWTGIEESFGKYFIYRKKEPDYETGNMLLCDTGTRCKMVEIRALKDAVEIINNLPAGIISNHERKKYHALKKLVEGNK